jgi:hypothetical protein
MFLLLTAPPLCAQRLGCADPHIRSNVPELLSAMAAGVRGSVTFRALVDRLNESDVVVYLICRRQPAGTAAHLQFVGADGGRRYVQVSLDPALHGCMRLMLLGHELQHAVEVADAPTVVDPSSLATLYRHIGFQQGAHDALAMAFDTEAAIAIGQHVRSELTLNEVR